MLLLPKLLSFLAPADCLVCGHEGAIVCDNCLPNLPRPRYGRCLVCHIRATDDQAGNKSTLANAIICPKCLLASRLDSLQAVSRYDGPAADLVAALKFEGHRAAVRPMARLLAAAGPGLVTNQTIISHIPATTRHIRQRGYDQAEVLAHQLAKELHLPHHKLLARQGQHHQLGSGRDQRQAAMAAAMWLPRPGRANGQHILLIDDVLTTGATLSAAAHLLKAAGAARIDALTFAQA